MSLVIAAAEILESFPDGLSGVDLCCRLRERSIEYALICQKQLSRILSRHSAHFTTDAAGKWLLRVAANRAATTRALDASPPQCGLVNLRTQDIVVFDVEATSNDSKDASIIQLAAVRLDGRFKQVARFSEQLVRPPTSIPPEISKLTGIRDEDVIGAPSIIEVLPVFLSFAAGAILVAHNGSNFDGPLIARLAGEQSLSFDLEVVDSITAACIVLPQQPTRSLAALCEAFAIPMEEAHRAGADVDALVQVLHAIRSRVAGFPPGLRELLAWILEPHTALRRILDLGSTTTDASTLVDPDDALLGIARRQSVSDPRPPGPPTCRSDVEAVLRTRGPVATVAGPQYESRPSQVQMAGVVWDALAEGHTALIEAGTGTGKTRAYLVPSILWSASGGGPVAVSTHTKALQDQLLGELRFLESVPGLAGERGWSFAVLKGRRNYLCLYKLAEALRELNSATGAQRRLALAMLSVWAYGADQGYDDEFALGWVGSRDVSGEARATVQNALCDNECPERECPFYEQCYYFGARRRAESADVVAVNHALLLSSKRWQARFASVIVDEAHGLEDAATDALTTEVSATTIAAVLQYLTRPEGHGSAGLRVRFARAFGLSLREGAPAALALAVASAVGRLEGASVALRRFLHDYDHKKDADTRYGHSLPYGPSADQRPWLRATEPVHRLIEDLRSVEHAVGQLVIASNGKPVIDSFANGRGLYAEAQAAREVLLELADCLQGALSLSDRLNRVYLLEAPALPSGSDPEYESELRAPRWRFRAPPIEVGVELDRRLFSNVRSAVLTSATLTVNGSFDFIRQRLGLESDGRGSLLREVVVASPFDYRNQVLLAIPGHLPAPRTCTMAEYLERLGSDLIRYTRTFDGRTLALFTARAQIEVIAGHLEDPLAEQGLTLYAQGGTQRVDSLVRGFKQNPKGLLAGVRTLWEGLDIPGPALQHVWITKLPFPNLGDPLLRARQERLIERTPNLNPFDDFLLPLTVIQFKQGFGRLIRTQSDRGAVVVSDRRLRGSIYRDVFLNSLPDPSVTESSDVEMYHEIADFLNLQIDRSQLGDLPLTTVDELIARYRLTASEDLSSARSKIEGALALFQLSPPYVTGFRQFQLEIMLASLAGDTLAILPTGAGKSLCFQLPALLRDGVTIVVSPLVALMKDQVDKLRRDRGIHKVRAIDHSVTQSERNEILEDVAAGRCKLLYLAPERLRDQSTIDWLRELLVVQIVVDEAHCVSLWGPTFRPEFLAIAQTRAQLGNPPILALTATATPDVRQDIEKRLQLDLNSGPQSRLITTGFDRKNLVFGVVRLPTRRSKGRELIRILSALGPEDTAIVYVARKRDAERLAALIENHCRIAARAYHAGLPASLRASIQEAFTENGAERLQVIVATKAFGMGIDKPDIRYVIHYDMPDSLESYYQEAGRAGRDDKQSYCVMLHTGRDRDIHEFFIQQSAPPTETVRRIYATLMQRRPGRGNGITSLKGQVFVTPAELAETSDVSETTLRIILHALEEKGLLSREEFDFGTRARVKLRRSRVETEARIREAAGLTSTEKQTVTALIERLQFVGADDREFDVRALAAQLAVSPVELERVLLRLSRAPFSMLIYRSWERGIALGLAPDPVAPEAFGEDLFANHRSLAQERLGRITCYAVTRGCRRRLLLEHLGDSYPPGNCRGCDNCISNMQWPWANAPLPPPTLDGGLHLPWEILRAVAWADGRFSRKQLEAALRGQERYGPRMAFTIHRHLLAADFFGRMQYVAKARFSAALESLLVSGLIAEQERTSDASSRPYRVLVPTAAGRAAQVERQVPSEVARERGA